MKRPLLLQKSICTLALLSLLSFYGRAQIITPTAGIVYVRPIGNGNGSGWNNATSDLQSAINAAGVQMVFVEKGTYYPANSGYVMKNGVAIYGGFDPGNGISSLSDARILPNPYNNNGSILSGSLQRSVVVNSFSSSAPLDTTAVLDGFTLTDGSGATGAGGMLNLYASPTLRNLAIKSNAGNISGGIYNNNSSPVITNCYIKGNYGSLIGGMYNDNNSAPVLTNTEISNNISTQAAGQYPGGIYVNASATIQLINCTVAGNAPFGMKGVGNAGIISNSIVYGLQGGTYQVNYSILDSTLYTLNGNSTQSNISPYSLFVDTQQIFRLKAGAAAIDAGKDSLFAGLTANTKDLGGNVRKTGNVIDIGAFEYAVIPDANGIVYVKPTATGFGTGTTWQHATDDLQGAINTPGVQKIYVAKGTYYTQSQGLVMKNGVAVYGGFDPDNGITTLNNNRIIPGNDGSILSGNNQHTVIRNDFTAANPLDNTAVLDGFKITGGNSTGGGGILNNYASPTLSNLLITGNSAIGAVYNAFSAPKLYNISIVNNSAAGFYQVGCVTPTATLTNVTLANNSSSAVYTSSGTITLQNTIACGGMTGAYTAFNSLVQNGSDTTNGNVNGTGVTLSQLFVSPSGGDYRLLFNAPVINKGNNTFFTGLSSNTKDLAGKPRLFADTVDIGAYEFNITHGTGNIVYVKPAGTGLGDGTSWVNATADIQAAINAQGTQKVFAAVGVYYRTAASLVMKNGVEIYGGFDPANGIDSLDDARIMPSPADFSVGSILEASWTRPVIFNSFGPGQTLNSSAKIDGFTVAGGAYWTGAGIYNDWSSATFNNLVIRDNHATGDGGGMFIGNSNPTINNSYIIRNQGAVVSAIEIDDYASPVFNNVEISRNNSFGNGDPQHGTVIAAYFSNFTLRNCTVAGNTPYHSAYPAVCVFTNVYSAYIRNSIIIGGKIKGGFNIASSLVQDMNILFDDYLYTYDYNGNVTDSLAYPYSAYADYGNLFTDPDNGFFRLRNGSAAINAGSNSYFPGLTADTKDLDYNPRVAGGTIDAGAHEYNVYTGNNATAYVKTTESGAGDGTSWANATNNLQGAINADGVQKVFVEKGTYQVPSPHSFIMKNGVKVYGGFDLANGIDSLSDNRIMPGAPASGVEQGSSFGQAGSILDGKNERPVIWNVLTAANPMDTSAVLDGFTLKNATGINQGCIYNQYASPLLSNLFIAGNNNTGVYNIMSSPTITNTAIAGNSGGGLYQKGGAAILRNVTIGGNEGNALSLVPYDVNNPGAIGMLNSVVFGGISGYSNGNMLANYSFVENNAVPGFFNADATGWTANNVFADIAAKDYSLRYNVPAINTGSNNAFPDLAPGSRDLFGNLRLADTVIDMGAYEFKLNPFSQAMMYVKPVATGAGTGNSWANATAKLQQSIDGDGIHQVWVAKGNYNIPAPTTSFVMKNNVAIYGGFDPDNGITTLSNNRITPDTSGTTGSVLNGMHLKPVIWNFRSASDPLDSTAILDGFALVNGNSSTDGGGMNNWYASPTLRNLVFKNNTANYGGGLFNRQSSPITDKLTLINNTANINGGGVYNNIGSPVFTKLTLIHNTAVKGGGMYNDNVSPNMGDVTAENNAATNSGGVLYNNNATVSVNSITANNNTVGASGGVLYNDNTTLTVSSSLTANSNTATNSGGVLYNNGSTLSISSITAQNNTAGASGGVMYNHNDTVSVSGMNANNNTAADSGGFMYNTGGAVSLYGALIKENNAGAASSIFNLNTPMNLTNSAIINNNNKGLVQQGDTLKMINSTIAGNAAYGLDITAGAATMQNSIVFGQNGTNYTAQISFVEGSSDTANGNINTTGITPAQLFANPVTGNYNLKMPVAAPLVSTGSNDFFPDPFSSSDVEGKPRIKGSFIDVGAYEYGMHTDTNKIVYVKITATGAKDGSSWANATNLLQDAFDAPGMEQVWVEKGVYYVAPHQGFRLRGGSIYGGFDPDNGIDSLNDNRILPDTANNEGSILDGKNIQMVVEQTGSTMFDGFTLRNGNGAGITITGSPTLNNLVIRNNAGNGIENTNNSPTISNVVISNNTGAGINNYYGSPTLSNLVISGNGGGGMYNAGYFYSANPVLQDVIIKNNTAFQGAGFWNYGSNPVLNNVIIEGNTASDGGGGIYNAEGMLTMNGGALLNNSAAVGGGLYNADKYSDYTLNNVKIQDNTAGYKGGGVYSYTGTGVINNGLITGNVSNQGGSAVSIRTNKLTMNNVTIADNVCNDPNWIENSDIFGESNADSLYEIMYPEYFNQDGYYILADIVINNGIVFGKSSVLHSYRPNHCLVAGYLSPFYFDEDTLTLINGENIVPADVFTDPANGDYTLGTASPAINKGVDYLFPGFDSSSSTDLAGNLRKTGSAIDLGAYESTIIIHPDGNGIAYVKPVATGTKTGDSWANATDNIPEAVKGAGTQQVWVAKGNYPIRGIGFAMKNGVKIYGGFDPDNGISTLNDPRIMPDELANTSTGGGSILDGRNRQPVILNLFKDSTAIDTSARLDGFTITQGKYDFGSGIQNKYASPYLTNLVVKNCVTEYDGGGIYNDSTCAPVMSNMIVTGNSGSYGGGIFNRNAAPVMENVWLKNNTVTNNGGGIYNNNGATPVMTNVAITGNTAVNGGGMFNDNATSAFTNATIAGNVPDALAASNGGAASLSNSILFGSINGSYTAQSSLVEGDAGGTNGNLDGTNILMSQVFTDIAAGDYTLKNGSPAIDTGSNALFAGLDTGTLDLAGNHRLVNGVIDLGAFEFGTGSPLPIKLLTFTAQKQGMTALLQWTTANEQNSKGFDIERSGDSRTWSKIGYVSCLVANGNSTAKLDYRFVDAQPLSGKNFYRLKQTDFDGKSEYSVVRMVSFNGNREINIYPNPASNKVNIAGLKGDETVLIYDASGRLVQQVKCNNINMSLSLKNLENGAYHIFINSPDGERITFKLIKAE